MEKNYRKTLTACYLGFITQAIASNFAPLLFLTFHKEYGVSLGKIALIPTAFFITQILVDVFCAKYVDRIGHRRSVILSEITSGLGLAGLAVLPDLFRDPFTGIIICVVIYAVGSGLIEVMVSPTVEACPFEHKAAEPAAFLLLLGICGCYPAFNAVLCRVRGRTLEVAGLYLGARPAV